MGTALATVGMGAVPADELMQLCLLASLLVLGLAVWALRAEGVLARRRQAAEAAAQRAWARHLGDAAFDGLLVHRQGQVLQMNRALTQMLGVREREWLGQPFANLARPDQAASLRAELEAPQPRIGQFFLRRADQNELAVELCSQAIAHEGQPATVTAIRDIGQRLADAAKIARLESCDGLTGLLNARHFATALAAALARDRQGATSGLIMLDIDGFKTVNMRLGREAGDALLRQAANRIAAHVGPGDLLGRIGGDKFAVLPRGADAARSTALAEALRSAFAEPFIADGQLVRLGISLGIALHPAHAPDAPGLLHAAELALSQARRAGGGRACLFAPDASVEPDPAAAAPAPDEKRLAAELHHAAARGELQLLYQPVFRAGDLTIVGFEALARWQHPELGLIGPERFLPLAEAAGLTREIGLHLLAQACAAARPAEGLTLSVNLAPGELRDAELAERIAAILRQTGLAPARLEIEIAERLLIEDRAATMRTLAELDALGIGVALDHFGTGYSSLSALAGLNFTRLKLDRRIVTALGQDENAQAIVAAVLTLAGHLKLEVTAVGVETEAQLALLRRLGCPSVQGDLLGPPVQQPPVPRRAAALAGSRG